MTNYAKLSQNNKPSTDASFLMHLIIVVVALIALSVASNAYDCELQQDQTCLVYLDEVLDDNATLDDALLFCESIDGIYIPEHDICHVTNIIEHK